MDQPLPSSIGPELVFGLISAVGTDLDELCSTLRESLSAVGYSTDQDRIRLSKLLTDVFEIHADSEKERYESLMDAGDELRKGVGRNDAVAMLGVNFIQSMRQRENNGQRIQRRAFLIHQLKHPSEVNTLRNIYGPAFIAISAYARRDTRLRNIAQRMADSEQRFDWNEFRGPAEEIIKRDEEDAEQAHGQRVRGAFHLADFFVDVTDPASMVSAIKRIVDLLFNDPFITPTREEYAMFHAKAAALRSASLQRQVGAVIASEEGDIISIGTNEVPKPGGGLYWCGDESDGRDFVRGKESSDEFRRRAFAEILGRLISKNWLRDEKTAMSIDQLVDEAHDVLITKGSRIFELIEFGRCVHAEMAAIVDAARRGVSVKDAVLFSTTFPCHECARHIVAAGIKEVVYIEPYAKSLVSQLYLDSISVEGIGGNNQVVFKPFVGVSPRRYLELFAMTGKRRDERTGKILRRDKKSSLPKLGEYWQLGISTAKEDDEVVDFNQRLTSFCQAGKLKSERIQLRIQREEGSASSST